MRCRCAPVASTAALGIDADAAATGAGATAATTGAVGLGATTMVCAISSGDCSVAGFCAAGVACAVALGAGDTTGDWRETMVPWSAAVRLLAACTFGC